MYINREREDFFGYYSHPLPEMSLSWVDRNDEWRLYLNVWNYQNIGGRGREEKGEVEREAGGEWKGKRA